MNLELVIIGVVIINLIAIFVIYSKIIEKIDKSNLENKINQLEKSIKYFKLNTLVNVSNELGEHKKVVYEDEYFLQEFGQCKILKIVDKENNEITHISYDEFGKKYLTQTFKNDTLKYSMEYKDDKLTNGFEYNDNGTVSFSYWYNEAEEISKRIDYIYSENGQQLKEKKEINY